MTTIVGAVPNNTVEMTALVVTTGATAVSAASMATALGAVTLQIQALTTQLLLANRGAAVGVKSLTSGNNIAVTQAVITRRNSLAGPEDQLPVPPTPPGI